MASPASDSVGCSFAKQDDEHQRMKIVPFGTNDVTKDLIIVDATNLDSAAKVKTALG